jgi:hypothetical protein
MKLDPMGLLQLAVVLTLAAGFIMYIASIYKKALKSIGRNFNGSITSIGMDYSRGMTVKEYTAYEKYCIWRFCVHWKYK